MPASGSAKIRPFCWLAAVVLILLGTVCSAYLLARHFSPSASDSTLFDICGAVFGANCDEVISGDLAVQFGIPLAGWGLVHFCVVAAALIFAVALGDTFRGAGILTALALCSAAAVLGTVLTAMMIARGAFCPLCVFVHLTNLLLVSVILLASGRTIGQLRASIGRGLRFLAGSDDEDPLLMRWNVAGLATLALVGIVVYQWVLIQADRHARAAPKPRTFEQARAEFEAGPTHDIPWANDDPRLGERDAPLELVIFSDFQCPACRRFAQRVAHVREHHPDLAVVFKHYPLGKACNPGLRVDLHPLSCGAARAAEAARRQDKFWEYHDALFAAAEPLDEGALRQLAQSVGLDLERFDADCVDPATSAKVAADIALGKELKIIGTPSAFLGKKALPDGALVHFEQLIEHQAARARR